MQAKYKVIKQTLKSKILAGAFLPHQKIKSENELMKEFRVSRHTVRVAIGELVNEGWLYREQGAGTFCADRSTERPKDKGHDIYSVAILTTYISDYIFPSIIRGAESYLSEHGCQVSIFSTNNDTDKERHFLETILSHRFDGVIVEPTKSAFSCLNSSYYFNLERQNIPYLMINGFYEELEPISLLMDDEAGGFLQAKHLIESGHRDIAGFFKTDDRQGVKRMKGYVKAHRQYGVPIDPERVITYQTEEKETKPAEALARMLSEKELSPTGLVCYNDQLALSLLDTVREKGLQVPRDISVVGYDDSFLAQASEVKLTTIKHPKNRLGQDAAEMIVKLMNCHSKRQREECALQSVVYEPELIVRHSTKVI